MQMAYDLKEADLPHKVKPWKLVLWDGKKANRGMPYSDMKKPVIQALLGKRCLVIAVHSISRE